MRGVDHRPHRVLGDTKGSHTGRVGVLEPDLFGKRRRFRAWIFTPCAHGPRSVTMSSIAITTDIPPVICFTLNPSCRSWHARLLDWNEASGGELRVAR